MGWDVSSDGKELGGGGEQRRDGWGGGDNEEEREREFLSGKSSSSCERLSLSLHPLQKARDLPALCTSCKLIAFMEVAYHMG